MIAFNALSWVRLIGVCLSLCMKGSLTESWPLQDIMVIFDHSIKLKVITYIIKMYWLHLLRKEVCKERRKVNVFWAPRVIGAQYYWCFSKIFYFLQPNVLSMEVKSVGSLFRLPWVKSWLHFLAVWASASCLTCLCLSLIIHKMGIIIVITTHTSHEYLLIRMKYMK